jgi:Fe-S-cluster containining protein
MATASAHLTEKDMEFLEEIRQLERSYCMDCEGKPCCRSLHKRYLMVPEDFIGMLEGLEDPHRKSLARVIKSGELYRVEFPVGVCPFFDQDLRIPESGHNGGCGIYDSRPGGCRNFPFDYMPRNGFLVMDPLCEAVRKNYDGLASFARSREVDIVLNF